MPKPPPRRPLHPFHSSIRFSSPALFLSSFLKSLAFLAPLLSSQGIESGPAVLQLGSASDQQICLRALAVAVESVDVWRQDEGRRDKQHQPAGILRPRGRHGHRLRALLHVRQPRPPPRRHRRLEPHQRHGRPAARGDALLRTGGHRRHQGPGCGAQRHHGSSGSCPGGRVAVGRPGGGAPAGGDQGADGDHDADQRGVDEAGVAAGPLLRELPVGGGRRGAAAGAPGDRDHGPGGVRAVRGGAPPLLLPPHLHGRRLPLREDVHEQGLSRDDVGTQQVPADRPGARIQLPLHGRGRDVVPRPVPAHLDGGGHRDLERRVHRRPVQPGQLPQRRLPVRAVEREDDRVLPQLAGGAVALLREARAGRVQPDQARDGGPAAARHPVPRHHLHQRLLPAQQGPQQDLHPPRQLLRRPRRQAPRPPRRPRRLEELHRRAARREEGRQVPMEAPRRLHPLMI